MPSHLAVRSIKQYQWPFLLEATKNTLLYSLNIKVLNNCRKFIYVVWGQKICVTLNNVVVVNLLFKILGRYGKSNL